MPLNKETTQITFFFSWLVFYGISTLSGYLMQNPDQIYIYIEQVLEATPHKAPTIQPPTSHHENYPS